MGRPEERLNRIDEIQCVNCRRITSHTVRGAWDTSRSNEDESIWLWHEHDLLVCNGCQAVTYRNKMTCTEDPVPDVILWPRRADGEQREPVFYQGIPWDSGIESVYREVICCFNDRHRTLAAAGIRLLIEGVCVEQQVLEGPVPQEDGSVQMRSNLQGKIYGLAQRGLISQTQAESLHEIRFLGNDAAHRLDTPSIPVLSAAVDIVEHLLTQVYENPIRLQRIQSRTRPQ